jgi:hypothetical protein
MAKGAAGASFLSRPGNTGMGAPGVAGWFFSLLTGGVLLAWLYNEPDGSILAVALFHAADVQVGESVQAVLACHPVSAARPDSGGFSVEPTVFDGVSNDMKIAREKSFGPVMSVLRFSTEAQAIALANDSSHGLQASVWSDDLSRDPAPA